MIETRHRDGRGRSCRTPAGDTPAIAVIDDDGDIHRRVAEILGEEPVRVASPGDLDLGASSSGRLSLVDLGGDIVAAAGLPSLGRDPAGFISAMADLRVEAGPNRLLLAPHCATPHTVPLIVYAGGDLVDPWETVRTSVRGGRFTPYTSVDDDGDHLGTNLKLLADSVAGARDAVVGGYLRELVEATAPLTTSGVSALRALDRDNYGYIEPWTPVHRPRGMRSASGSLTRPDVLRFQERVLKRFQPPPFRTLLVLPCSARKPYSRSPSHRRFIDAVERSGKRNAVQELIATSPLGLVPRELERQYPANSYDIPVTGSWSEDERVMLKCLLASWLATHEYDAVILHLPDHMDFLRESAPDALWTSTGAPGSRASLDSLSAALHRLEAPRVKGLQEHAFRSVASFHFPSVDWLGEFRVRKHEAIDGGVLLRLSDRPHLTMDGGARMLDSGFHRVTIDDFTPSGSVLAPGVVDCTPEVRPGDEVVVVHGDELRAVGTAAMAADEMVQAGRGIAVRVKGR